MATFVIEALEMFETLTRYVVTADTEEEALDRVMAGEVAYVSHEHPGNDDQFLHVLEVSQADG